MSCDDRIAAFVLTGFLGSGKTTLLRRILAAPEYADSAVIVNELGEVGLDHELVAFSADSTVVMQGGCVCCSIREDIEKTLRELFEARDAGNIPPFRRLFIETTGIADPQPLLFTLRGSPVAATRLQKPRIVTVLDGILGAETLARHAEAVNQVAAADTVLISKRDLGCDDALVARVTGINPWARVHHANLLLDDVIALVGTGTDEAGPERAVLGRDGRPNGTHFDHGHMRTFSLALDTPLDWTAFGVWMTMLLHRHGRNILRIKGILNIEGSAGPVVFHAAQHLVHPPEHWTSWPSPDRRSRLVFIVRDLDPELIERSLKVFDAAARIKSSESPTDTYLPAGAGGMVAGRPVRRPTAPRWLKG